MHRIMQIWVKNLVQRSVEVTQKTSSELEKCPFRWEKSEEYMIVWVWADRKAAVTQINRKTSEWTKPWGRTWDDHTESHSCKWRRGIWGNSMHRHTDTGHMKTGKTLPDLFSKLQLPSIGEPVPTVDSARSLYWSLSVVWSSCVCCIFILDITGKWINSYFTEVMIWIWMLPGLPWWDCDSPALF